MPLLFYDRNRDLFITEYEISTDTNHSELEIFKSNINTDSYFKWLNQVQFPSHGLVIKSGSKIINKGICSIDELNHAIEDSFKKYTDLKLETDMRAMMNPSRMKVIANLASKLASKVATNCIKCDTPGFGNIEKSEYLRCEICHNKTRIPQFIDKKCLKCDYYERQEIDASRQYANPQYCDYCNP